VKKTHTKEETRSQQQQLQAHNQSIKHQVKQAISKPNRAVPLHLQSPNEQTLMPEKNSISHSKTIVSQPEATQPRQTHHPSTKTRPVRLHLPLRGGKA